MWLLSIFYFFKTIHLCSKWLLSDNRVPDVVLGTRNVTVKKETKPSPLVEPILY